MPPSTLNPCACPPPSPPAAAAAAELHQLADGPRGAPLLQPRLQRRDHAGEQEHRQVRQGAQSWGRGSSSAAFSEGGSSRGCQRIRGRPHPHRAALIQPLPTATPPCLLQRLARAPPRLRPAPAPHGPPGAGRRRGRAGGARAPAPAGCEPEPGQPRHPGAQVGSVGKVQAPRARRPSALAWQPRREASGPPCS